MKRALLFLFIPLCSFGQDITDLDDEFDDLDPEISNWTLTVSPYLQPMFFSTQSELITRSNVDAVLQIGVNAKGNYHFMDVFTAGIGFGFHNFDLRMNNRQFFGNQDTFQVHTFDQLSYYFTVPMEFGIYAPVFKGGWFVPSLTLTVTPHFFALGEQEIEYNENINVSQPDRIQIAQDFEGGMRESYTSMEVNMGFTFFVGNEKQAGIGPVFSYVNNFSGPQTYLLRPGTGFRAALTISARI